MLGDDQLLSVDYAPFDFLLKTQASPSPVETGVPHPLQMELRCPGNPNQAKLLLRLKEKKEALEGTKDNAVHRHSHPVCVRLMQLLATAIDERDRGTLDEKFHTASECVLVARKRMIEPLGCRGTGRSVLGWWISIGST